MCTHNIGFYGEISKIILLLLNKHLSIPSYFTGILYEPRHEKTNVLHMRKQRRRSASG